MRAMNIALSMVVAAGVAFHTGNASAQCVANGKAIPSVPDPTIHDAAMASIRNGVPVILVNPGAMRFLSPLFTQFVYWHECGHHVLGHIVADTMGLQRPYVDEQQADCFGIRKLVTDGLSDAGVSAIQAEASRVLAQAGDGTHLPAIVRAANLRACLQTPTAPGPGTTGSTCRTEYVTRQVTRYRTVMQPRTVPCSHIVCGYYGCVRLHPFGDPVMVPVQVPYFDTEVVPQQVCGDTGESSGGDDSNTQASPSDGDDNTGASSSGDDGGSSTRESAGNTSTNAMVQTSG